MKLTTEIIETLEKQVPIPIATCSKPIDENDFSMPNLIYVSSIKVYDSETIIIADNKFLKTKENLKNNPYISICIYNPETNKSYQLKGRVTIHTDDEVYLYGLDWMESKRSLRKKKGKMIPKSIILVHIEEIYGKGTKLHYIDGKPVFIKEVI